MPKVTTACVVLLSFASPSYGAALDYDPRLAQRAQVLREAESNMLSCAWDAPRTAVAAGGRDQDQIVAFAVAVCGTAYKQLAPQFGGNESVEAIDARIRQAAVESLKRMPGVTIAPAPMSEGLDTWTRPPPLPKLTLRAEQAGRTLGRCLRAAAQNGAYPLAGEDNASRSIKQILGERCEPAMTRWVRECAGAGNNVDACVAHMTFVARESILEAGSFKSP